MWLFPRPFQLKIIVSDGFVISQLSWLSCSEDIKARGPAEGLQTHTLKGRAPWPESQDSHRCLRQCVYSRADIGVFERSFLGSPHVAGLVIMLGETFQMKRSRRGWWKNVCCPLPAYVPGTSLLKTLPVVSLFQCGPFQEAVDVTGL